MSPFAHSVRAWLAAGWHEQGCTTAHEAEALFDRLRRLAPGLTIERLASGRAVEIARPPAPGGVFSPAVDAAPG